MKAEFSVLMSLYIKEKVEYARACFESLLSQTVPATEWVIVEDGPLSEDMYQLIEEYQAKYPGLIKRVPLETNKGLGLALAEGIHHCNYDLVARMDTDDIAREDRFEKQLAMFKADSELDICGSHIIEFDGDLSNVLSKRIVPITDEKIKIYQKRRDAFNHMTVMYKKSSVLRAGNYQSCLLMEDTLLWVNMILSGAKCVNVDDFLVYARTGAKMFERRGGIGYYKKYKSGRKKVYDTGYISWWDYRYSLIVQFIVVIVPNKLRSWIFKKLLRKN